MLCRLSEISASPQEYPRYDLCIVGAGAAGLAIATRFLNTNVRVCLLESGAASPSTRYQRLNEASSVGLEYDCVESRCRAFGGTLHVWGGRCGTLDPVDFASRSWVPDSGWPIAHHDLEPHYAAALAFLGVSNGHALDKMADEPERRVLGAAVLKDAFSPKPFLVLRHVNSRFCQALRADIAGCPNITLVEDATAVELTQGADDAVDAVLLRSSSIDGLLARICAETYVICTGGLETPRLLLASHSRNENGIGNANDLVGRFFMDHPRIRSFRFSPDASVAAPAPVAAAKAPFGRHFGFTLHRDIQEKYGLLNHTLFVGPANADIESSAAALVSKGGAGPSTRAPTARRGRRRGRATWMLRRVWRTLPPFLRSAIEAAATSRSSRKFAVTTKIEQMPNRESRLFLSRERDRLGYAKICLDWRISAADRENIRTYHSIIQEAFNRGSAGTLQIAFPDPELDGIYQDSSHPTGTTRIGTDARSGVVDSNLQVFGVRNLYLCSSSVFPTAGSVNPTLTIVALAHRLARHLSATIRPT